MPKHKGKNGKDRKKREREIKRKGKMMKKEETKEDIVRKGKARGGEENGEADLAENILSVHNKPI